MIALSLALALSAAAQDGSAIGSLAVDGRCDRLVVIGDDATGRCGGTVINSSYDNGRTNFAYDLGGDAYVVFSGGAAQTRVGDDVSQPIDRIILIREGHEPAASNGEGVCAFGNPYAGSTTIHCRITTPEGVSEGVFVTDGSTPRQEQL